MDYLAQLPVELWEHIISTVALSAPENVELSSQINPITFFQPGRLFPREFRSLRDLLAICRHVK
jgi:hypothetical protein